MKVLHPNGLDVPTSPRSGQNPQLLGFDRRSQQWIDRAIDQALEEDLGTGDITTQAVVASDTRIGAELWLKQDAVVAGLPIFARVFSKVDPAVAVDFLCEDGRWAASPVIIARLEGPARSILIGERVALNFLQRLSGVATGAHAFAKLAAPYGISILDTRKTTPGLRALERYAVRIAGGTNHRFDLSEAILIKDNHIRMAGSVLEAVRRARLANTGKRLEVEVTTIEELRQALAEKVDAVLLDNMSPDRVREALCAVERKCFVEVSGGITLDNISNYLIPGVDAISIGGITHSARSIDISLEIEG